MLNYQQTYKTYELVPNKRLLDGLRENLVQYIGLNTFQIEEGRIRNVHESNVCVYS